MDFSLDSTQVAMRDALRRYLKAEVAPMVDRCEANKEPVPRSVIEAMSQFGFIGGTVAPEAGGFGLPMVSYCTLTLEVARVWPSLRSVAGKNTMMAKIIAECGSPELQKKYLPKLLSGETIACFALSEPNIGTDARHVEARAEQLANGNWRIRGRKTFITNGPICDVGVVFARTQLDDGTSGVSCLVFESSMPGFSCTKLEKMGMHSAPLGELLFDDVEVPAENLVGAKGAAFSIAKKYLNMGRASAAFSALGVGEAALESAITYAKERVQFGRPIGSFQLVQNLIADMMQQVETSRLMAYRAADAVDRMDPQNKILCSMAKRYVTEAMLRVAETSLQVHGGAGYTMLFPVERYYRDVRHLSIAEGTNALQGMLMAQEVLGVSAIAR